MDTGVWNLEGGRHGTKLGVKYVGFGLEFNVFANQMRFFGRRLMLPGQWKEKI